MASQGEAHYYQVMFSDVHIHKKLVCLQPFFLTCNGL